MPRSPGVSVIIPWEKNAEVLPRLLGALEVDRRTPLDFDGPNCGVRRLEMRPPGCSASGFPRSGYFLMATDCFPGRPGTGGRRRQKGLVWPSSPRLMVPERRWLETLHGLLDFFRSDRHGFGDGGAAGGGRRGGSGAPLDRVLLVPARAGVRISGHPLQLQSPGPEGGVPGVRGFRREPGDGRGPDALPEDQWASGNTTISQGRPPDCLSLERCGLGTGLGPAAAKGATGAGLRRTLDEVPERRWLRHLHGSAGFFRSDHHGFGVSVACRRGQARRLRCSLDRHSQLDHSWSPGWRPDIGTASPACKNLVVRKEEFLECGGFGENLEMAEDLMLCRRITRRVGTLLYIEASTGVCHSNDVTWEKAWGHLRRFSATGAAGSELWRRSPGRGCAIFPLSVWRFRCGGSPGSLGGYFAVIPRRG